MARKMDGMREDMAAIARTDEVTDVAKLDDHLSRLYRDAVGSQDATTAVPIVKVVLLNLIVYSQTEEAAARVMSGVGKIIGSHPCRSIVVDDMPAQTGEPPATVSLVCGITERGDRTLCGDIIRIHSHGDSAGVIGSVLPLLVPDVPVFLWVTGEIPADNDDFNDLLEVSDYIITDSRRYEDKIFGLNMLIELQSVDNKERAIDDLCWVGLHAWRESIAQHFDPPSTREYLAGLNEIVIRYSGSEGNKIPPMAPLLIVGWLIERTGMEIEGASVSDNECRINATQDGNQVQIRMLKEKADIEPGRLLSVTIKATGENGIATFFTQASGSGVSIFEECAGICFPPRVIELPSEDEAYFVTQVLSSYRRDTLYDDAVRVVLEIINSG